jgi:uncharacterized protein YjcR
MKKEAREKAEKMYLKAAGKVTNREIATAVDVNALTVGRWKRDGNWEKKLKKLAKAAKPAAPAVPVVRKKAARDKAFKLFVDSGGSVTNKDLARRVGVSPATISKWKELDNWSEKLVSEPEPVAPPAAPERTEEVELDMNELASPEQIIQINRRIDILLKREHLSTSEVADLAEAKSDLLEGVEVYLAIVQQVKDLKED